MLHSKEAALDILRKINKPLKDLVCSDGQVTGTGREVLAILQAHIMSGGVGEEVTIEGSDGKVLYRSVTLESNTAGVQVCPVCADPDQVCE